MTRHLVAGLLLALAACAAPAAAAVAIADASGPGARLLQPAVEELRHLLQIESGYPDGAGSGGLVVTLAWVKLDASAAEFTATLRDRAGALAQHRFKANSVRLLSPFSQSEESAALAQPVFERLLAHLPPPPRAPPSFEAVRERVCASPGHTAPASLAPRPVTVLGVRGERGCGPLCRLALLTYRYEAVEANVKADELVGLKAGEPRYGLADRPGLWRFRLSRHGDPACRAFAALEPDGAAAGRACIAAEPAALAAATLIAERDFRQRRYDWGFDLIRRERLRDAAGAVIAERERHGLQRLDRPAPSGILWCGAAEATPLFVTAAPPSPLPRD